MKSSLVAAGLVAALCAATAACSSGQPIAAPADATTTASAPAAPTTVAPSPSVKEVSNVDLETAVVTAKELGRPWKPSSGASGEAPWGDFYCPQPHRALTQIDAAARYWQGYYQGRIGGAAVELAALTTSDGATARAAYQADLTSCTKFSWKNAGGSYYSVDKAGGPVTVASADEVIGATTRRAYVVVKGSPHLIEVSRTLLVRKGQFLIVINYSNYTEAADGPGKGAGAGFTPLQLLATKQLSKLSSLT